AFLGLGGKWGAFPEGKLLKGGVKSNFASLSAREKKNPKEKKKDKYAPRRAKKKGPRQPPSFSFSKLKTFHRASADGRAAGLSKVTDRDRMNGFKIINPFA